MSDLTERIQLTREHRDLILKHGYVSGRFEAALRRGRTLKRFAESG